MKIVPKVSFERFDKATAEALYYTIWDCPYCKCDHHEICREENIVGYIERATKHCKKMYETPLVVEVPDSNDEKHAKLRSEVQ